MKFDPPFQTILKMCQIVFWKLPESMVFKISRFPKGRKLAEYSVWEEGPQRIGKGNLFQMQNYTRKQQRQQRVTVNYPNYNQ